MKFSVRLTLQLAEFRIMVSRTSNLVCDNDVLQEHVLYAPYHKPLYEIALKDYMHDSYFQSRPDIEGIDIDQFEADSSIDNCDMTMDAMVGVADYSNNRTVNKRLLLLELRMDYDSTNNLRHTKLCGKIKHTRAIIGTDVRIDEEHVFVFHKDVAEKAKKWMFNTSQVYSDAKNWIAMSTEELENMLQSQNRMPYQPITNMKSADEELNRLVIAGDFDSALELIDHWHKQAENFKIRYQLKEVDHIKQHLHDTWQSAKAMVNNITSEQQDIVSIIEEDYGYLKDWLTPNV